MQPKIWQGPRSSPNTVLGIREAGVVLGRPAPSEPQTSPQELERRLAADGALEGTVSIPKEDLFRIVAEPRSRSLRFAYWLGGVKTGSFDFACVEERDAAALELEVGLGLQRSRQKRSGGWAEAVKPALYLAVVLMITLGLAGALAEGASGVNAAGRTAVKADSLVALAQPLGPTGVWIVGGILSTLFLFRTLVALRVPGELTVLEPRP